MPGKLWLFVCLLCAAGVCYAVYRDVDLQKYSAMGDLRNRIAGARLQKDGIIPYMYEWKKGDELKYFDAYGDYSSEIGAITATPFFHSLLYPLTYFKEVTISRIWMVVQYLMLLGMSCIVYHFASSRFQKKLVVAAAILFLFTEAWVYSIVSGQFYLIIPFLFAVFVFCIKQKANFYQIVAGLSFISLILIRPNAVLFFLPFLVVVKSVPVKKLAFFCILPLLLMIYTLGSNQQRALWGKYKVAVAEHVKLHQGEQSSIPDGVTIAVSANLNNVTGSTDRVFYSENGNFFVMAKRMLGIKIPTGLLVATGLGVVIVLCFVFLKINFQKNPSICICAIFGACLYMINDLFSPIHRHQYYTMQWFFPLLVAAAIYQRRYAFIYVALAAGLLLNVLNTPFIKMEHTLGEYIWLLALLMLSFMYKETTYKEGAHSLKKTIGK